MYNIRTFACIPAVLACLSLTLGLTSCGDDSETEEEATTSTGGNALRGGQLYDKYWAVSGVLNPAAPVTDHPLWATRPDAASNTRTGADTWRCKECHGWDYKGNVGQYATGGHATGIKGVWGTALTEDQIVTALKDPAGHNYGAMLSEEDLGALASFVTTRLLDTSPIIDANGAFVGDAVAGQGSFDGVCTTCHGADGTNATPTGSAGGFEDFPGVISRDNPWEFVHKVRFGQPGTAMTPQADALDITGLANLGAYSQALP